MADQRSKVLKKLAYHLSLSYQEKATDALLPYLEDFQLFRRGRRKELLNVLEEVHPMLEYRLHLFDYQFYRGRGKHRRIHKQTVFFIRSRKLGLPAFHMRPESILHNLGEWLRLRRDIDFLTFRSFQSNMNYKGQMRIISVLP
jgi:hypothetical protein